MAVGDLVLLAAARDKNNGNNTGVGADGSAWATPVSVAHITTLARRREPADGDYVVAAAPNIQQYVSVGLAVRDAGEIQAATASASDSINDRTIAVPSLDVEAAGSLLVAFVYFARTGGVTAVAGPAGWTHLVSISRWFPHLSVLVCPSAPAGPTGAMTFTIAGATQPPEEAVVLAVAPVAEEVITEPGPVDLELVAGPASLAVPVRFAPAPCMVVVDLGDGSLDVDSPMPVWPPSPLPLPLGLGVAALARDVHLPGPLDLPLALGTSVLLLVDPPRPVRWPIATPPAWVAVPTVPDVEDWDAPVPDDDSRVRRVQWAVASIRERRWLGELLEARTEGRRSLNLDGGGEVQISVPTTDRSALATLLGDIASWGEVVTGRATLLDRSIHPVIDGRVGPGYVLRGEARISQGRVVLSGQAPSRLWADRIVGTAERVDLLGGRGMFRGHGSPASLGIQVVGDVEVRWATPGARADRALEIRGDSLTGHVAITTGHSAGDGLTGDRITVRSGAFLRIPDDAVEDTTVMLTEVYEGGERVSPGPGAPNLYAVQIAEDDATGAWTREPLTSAALLPLAPYTAQVVTRIYPASTESWTGISDLTVFRRDTFSTGVERDLVTHQALLIREGQTGRRKSSWSMPFLIGDHVGVSELGVWRHEDETPLTEALAAVSSRDDGPDLPWVDAQWRARCSARRGRVRTDIVIGPDDILGDDGWVHDPGSQVSELRAVTDRGNAYWRVASTARDTSRTDGHVIERQVRAPNDLDLRQLDSYTAARLAERAQPQETATIAVRGHLGRRLEVGDTVRVVQLDGFWRLDRMVRIVDWSIDDEADVVWLDVGTDEAA